MRAVAWEDAEDGEECVDGEAEFACVCRVDRLASDEVAEAFERERLCGGVGVWCARVADFGDDGERGAEVGSFGDCRDLAERELVGAAEVELGEPGLRPVFEECVGEF